MMRDMISSSVLISFIFAFSACSSGEDIPQKSDKEELEEIIDRNVEAVEQEAKSIKDAAAQAVKIIEEDAQAEIDEVKVEIDETAEVNPSIEETE